MRTKIIALGVSAVSAVTMAFGAIGPATAAEVPPGSITSALCAALPSEITGLIGQLGLVGSAVGTATGDVATRQAALDAAVTDFVNAAVAHVQTVNDGGNVVASGQVFDAQLSVLVDKILATHAAMVALFDAQTQQLLTGVNHGYLAGLASGLCAPVV